MEVMEWKGEEVGAEGDAGPPPGCVDTGGRLFKILYCKLRVPYYKPDGTDRSFARQCPAVNVPPSSASGFIDAASVALTGARALLARANLILTPTSASS